MGEMDDIKFKQEEEFLKKVQEEIGIERNKNMVTLESIPLEYKGRYAEVKWGDEDLVEHLSGIYIKRLNKLKKLEDKPYFGSFDFRELESQNQTFHIGKTDISKDNEILVLDWRNPICTLYYEQNIGNVSYKAPLGLVEGILSQKKQILIEEGKLKQINDVDLVTSDELLQPYLNIHADNRMKNIIASIQHEQNSIIRIPATENIIVQGVAGSGKTSVALHRIAYLLYNSSNKINYNDFAIIGPNKYFLKYISSILPDLDTEEVVNFTFEEISQQIINDKKYKIQFSNDEMDSFLLDKNFNVKTIKVKGTLEYKKALNEFLKDYFMFHLQEGIYFEDIEVIEKKYLQDGLLFKNGYYKKSNDFVKNTIQRIKDRAEDTYYELSRPLIAEMKKYPLKSQERNAIIYRTDTLKKMIYTGCVRELKQLIKPLLIDPISLYKVFLENIHNYLKIDSSELEFIKNYTLKMLKKKIIPYSDLAAILYISILREKPSIFSKYKHVVIDEGQDYNLFQYDIIKTLFSNSNFSIFGDLSQSIYLHRSIKDWNELNNNVFGENCSILNMNKSYRTTKEITEKANLILNELNTQQAEPVVRNGNDVEIQYVEKETQYKFYLDSINEYINKGYESIAIICKYEKEMDYVSNIMTFLNFKYSIVKSSDLDYNAGICILTSYLAKGLEFDAVIINDASEEIYSSKSDYDMRLLYVAMTRALHELKIFYRGNLLIPIKDEHHKVRVLKH